MDLRSLLSSEEALPVIASLLGGHGNFAANLGQGLFGAQQMNMGQTQRELEKVKLAQLKQAAEDDQQARQVMMQPQQQPQMPNQGMMPPAQGMGAPATNVSKADTFNKYNSIAERMEASGLLDRAKLYRDMAEKFRPEVKEVKTMMQGGKRVQVAIYKDGSQEVIPFDPDAEKAHFADTGGAIQPMDAFTGQPMGSGVKKSMSPGESARLGQAERHFQEGQGKPQLYDSPTGPLWVSPPARGSGSAQVTGPDGQPIAAKKRDQPLTESQGNATAYALRAEQSDGIIKQLQGEGFNPAEYPGVRNRLAGGPLNILAPDKAQQYNAAKKNFVTAVLRKESGAAISQSEFENEDQKYFPQPGDGQPVIEQKRKARELAIRALRIQSGPGVGMQNSGGGWSIKALD